MKYWIVKIQIKYQTDVEVIMNKLKDIIDCGFSVCIGKYSKGYSLEIQRRVSDDEFEEFETKEHEEFEDAVEEARNYVYGYGGE
jgi:hypothetical protein